MPGALAGRGIPSVGMRQMCWGVMCHPVPQGSPWPSLGRMLHPAQDWERRGWGQQALSRCGSSRAAALTILFLCRNRTSFTQRIGSGFVPAPAHQEAGMVPGLRTSIMALSPGSFEAEMLILVCGRSGLDSGLESLSLLPADSNSEHVLRDRASCPRSLVQGGSWITLSVKALINSRLMLLTVQIWPRGAAGETSSLLTDPSHHLPPPGPASWSLGTMKREILHPPIQHPNEQWGSSAFLPTSRVSTPKQGKPAI